MTQGSTLVEKTQKDSNSENLESMDNIDSKEIEADKIKNEDISMYIGRFQLCCKHKPGTFSKVEAGFIGMPFTFFAAFDMQMFNVALYPISLYYGISTTLSQWFVLIRSIANTAISPFVPLVLSKLGLRNLSIVFCIPIIIALCLIPIGPFWLAMVFRVISCSAFAMLIPLSTPTLRILTNSENLRGAISINSIFQAISTGLSPFLGGLFCDLPFGWKTIPYVSAGTMVITFFTYLFCLPKIPKQTHKHIEHAKLTKNPNFDIIGGITLVTSVLSLSIMFAIFSLVKWYVVVILICIGIIAFVIFIFHEKRLECNHLLDPRVYKSKQIMCGFIAMSGAVMGTRIPNVLTPLVFQQIYGLSSTFTGLLQAIIMPVGIIFGSVFVPILCRKMKPYILLTITMFITGVCGIVLCLCFIQNSWVPVFIFAIIFSITISMSSMANSASILLAAPPEIAPMIGTMQTLICAFAGFLGTSISVTVRDVLTPMFDNPVNPTAKSGIRMGSLISGSVISVFVLCTGILAICTKPAGRGGYSKMNNTVQSAVIGNENENEKGEELFDVNDNDHDELKDEIFVKNVITDNDDDNAEAVEGELMSTESSVTHSAPLN